MAPGKSGSPPRRRSEKRGGTPRRKHASNPPDSLAAPEEPGATIDRPMVAAEPQPAAIPAKPKRAAARAKRKATAASADLKAATTRDWKPSATSELKPPASSAKPKPPAPLPKPSLHALAAHAYPAHIDIEALTRNFARLFEEGGRAFAAYLKPRESGAVKMGYSDEVADAVKTLGHLFEYWYADPQRTFEMQTRLGKAYLELFANVSRRLAGQPTEPVARPEPRDKRFTDPEWSSNQYFDFLKQAYLVTADWARRLVADADKLDPAIRQKADFYMRQIVNAISPSNFVLTNPELLRTTLNENAENLVRGAHMLAEDIEAGGGELRIRQSDPSTFEVGRNLATTPGKVIYQNALMQLIQYAPTTERVHKRPLLIVPPWINKFYILDLTPQKSFIRWCIDQGLTVFVISWVNPDEHLAAKTFADYMREGPLEALNIIARATGQDAVDAAGYCVGGTLLAVALAYMAAKGDRRIPTATFLATQVDFTYAGDLKVFAATEEQVAAVERHMAERGYLEGAKMATAFNLLRSNDLVWPYVVTNYLKGEAPFPFDLLYWNSDATRMPAANHSFYLRNCYLDNNLSKGRVTIEDVEINLSSITIPVYNLATREDHIAPAKSVYLGSSLFGGPVRFVLSGSGHIAGVINPPASGKYQYWTGEAPKGEDVEAWLAKAEMHSGSWWTDWIAWLKSHDGEEVPARQPGGGKFTPIEDAPGSYVRARS